MNHTEHTAKPAVAHETGRFALLCGLLGARGTRAPKTSAGTRAPARALVLLCALVGVLAFAAAPASAERLHVFERSFGKQGSEAGQLENPTGVAVNDATHDIYVADTGNHRIDEFESNGTFVRAFGANVGGLGANVCGGLVSCSSGTEGSGPGQFTTPTFIAVDNSGGPSEGDVYVGDTGDSRVTKFSSAGALESGWGTGGQIGETPTEPFGQLVGIAVDSAGTLDVLENSSRRLFQFAQNGSFATEFPTPRGSEPKGLAVSSSGDFFKVDGNSAVEELEPSGADVGQVTLSTSATGVAVDSSTGDLYVDEGSVVERYSFNGSGEVIEPAGATCKVEPRGFIEPNGSTFEGCKPTESFGSPPNPTAGAGIAVDSSNATVYVPDAAAALVAVFPLEPPAPPVVESDSVLQVTDSSATFNAEIDPRDVPGDADTKYRFQYTTEERFAREGFTGAVSIPVPEGMLAPSFEVDHVSVPVQGLSAGTTYRFRVLVENGVGAAEQDTEHSFTTRATGSFGLPDGREWEMVSPPQKQGVLIEPIEGIGDGQSGAELQAAVAGDAITYLADAPSESGPQGYSNFVQVLSTRGVSGWSSSDLPLPHSTQTGLSIGEGQEYRFFSEDLSGAIVQPFGAFDPSLSPEASEQTAFLRTDFSPGSVGEPCLPASMHCYRPLVTGKEGYANVPPGTVIGREFTGNACKAATLICGPQFVGASPDLSHVVLRSSTPLTPNGGEYGLYEWSAGRLQPVNLLPPNIEGKELPSAGGASLGHSRNGFRSSRDAVSADGSSVFWSWEGHLYMRDTVREKTIQLDVPESEPSCPAIDECGTGEIEAEFQLASSNGNVVFFLDTQKLTANGTAYGSRRKEGTASGADLYECEISEDVCKLRDLAPAGGVVGSVLGASGDGQWVYFVANGVLAAGADAGSCPNSEEDEPSLHHVCNLYVSHDGVTSLVAVLSGEDKPDWSVNVGELTARVSPDGRWLAFMSQRSLTGYDNADAVSGRPDEEVYLYHAPESLASGPGDLACASCDPTGARPHGVEYGNGGPYNSEIPLVGGHLIWPQSTWLAGNIPTWTKSTGALTLYQSRYLSNSGRLFFNSSDALVPKDVNGTEDVYEYEPEGVPAGEHACSSASENGSDVFKSAGTVTLEEGTPGEHTVKEGAGCVALITDGTSSEESAFLDASETGGDVFFLTKAKLAPQDTDDALDVYDAQECTSKSPCAPPVAQAPVACNTEASCKAAPSPQPGIFGPAPSATFSGPGNLIPSPGVGKPAVRSLTRAQKLANALRLCKRDKNRSKRRACEKQAHHRYGASKAVKSANTNRRSK